MFELFGNSITQKVEKKKKIEGQIEVLKKQQKVESEALCHEYANRKSNVADTVDAQIGALKAQIKALQVHKETQSQLLDEELKVALDKTINDFNQKIITKQNQVKKLGYLIDAEKRNIEDVISPDAPNAPKTKVLVERK